MEMHGRTKYWLQRYRRQVRQFQQKNGAVALNLLHPEAKKTKNVNVKFVLFLIIGVVSMKRIIYTENNSQFIITLTEMEKWDRMHVVFGKVVKGNNVLFRIEDYGRKIGKPYADVIICNCGVREIEGTEGTEGTEVGEEEEA